jgi:hypothetical protein
MFGIGPVSFLARAHYEDGSSVRSDPIKLSIGLPDALMPLADVKPVTAGLKAIAYDEAGNPHHLVIGELDGVLREVRRSGLKAKRLVIQGYFHVAEAGFYQLGIRAGGTVEVSVNDQVLAARDVSPSDGERMLPLSLEPGWYKLKIDLTVSGRPFLKVVLGGDQVPTALGGDTTGHDETDAGR